MNSQQRSQALNLLAAVRLLLLRPGNNFFWTEWSGPEQAVEEIDRICNLVEADHAQALERLTLLFAPTVSLQDVSIDSGWSSEYMDLASRFDHLRAEVGDG